MPGHGLNLKNIKVNPNSGSVNQTPSKRSKSEASGEYERVRLREIEQRCELYALKLERLKADLLDRAEVEAAYSEITSAIRTVIAGSKLSRSEKRDILSNLLTVKEFAANVTRQSADRAKNEAGPVISNGIDHAIDSQDW